MILVVLAGGRRKSGFFSNSTFPEEASMTIAARAKTLGGVSADFRPTSLRADMLRITIKMRKSRLFTSHHNPHRLYRTNSGNYRQKSTRNSAAVSTSILFPAGLPSDCRPERHDRLRLCQSVCRLPPIFG